MEAGVAGDRVSVDGPLMPPCVTDSFLQTTLLASESVDIVDHESIPLVRLLPLCHLPPRGFIPDVVLHHQADHFAPF